MIHGHAGKQQSPTYTSWASMIQRCTDRHHSSYGRYGGHGVNVCKRWRSSFKSFLADMGERPAGTTLDRKDGTKGYSKANCRWSTPVEQMRNRSATKLDDMAVARIREGIALKVPQRWIAFHFGIHQSTVSEIKLGKIWS